MYLSQKDKCHTVTINRTHDACKFLGRNFSVHIDVLLLFNVAAEEKRGNLPREATLKSQYAFDNTANQFRPPHSPPQKGRKQIRHKVPVLIHPNVETDISLLQKPQKKVVSTHIRHQK